MKRNRINPLAFFAAAQAALLLSVFIASSASAGHHGSKHATQNSTMTQQQDIVDTAVAAGSFKTLAAALEAAGLVDTLKGDGPFTVFAPTDAAFARLPAGTVESLLKPENRDQLIAVLTYHVVPGKVTAATVTTLDTAKTVNGNTVAIKTSGDGVRINNATVVKADVMATNGIIHVVDTVILPPAS